MTDSGFRAALGRGCLSGIVLAALYALVSVGLFLVGRLAGIATDIALVAGIAGGPVLVSVVVFTVLLRRSRQQAEAGGVAMANKAEDEPTARDSA